jgi:hypothetical protein
MSSQAKVAALLLTGGIVGVAGVIFLAYKWVRRTLSPRAK